eukprot:12882891-Prorocentrum_lima.AAC.1
MQEQLALWHDYEMNGFPEWAPKALRGDILLIGGHSPWEQNSHANVQLQPALKHIPPEKRARAAACYMLAREE